MQTFEHYFEMQVDEMPNGAVIRVNDARGCRIRICGVPRELVFNEQGEVRTFIDITYPKQTLSSLINSSENINENPKNLRLSKLGEKFKREKKVVKFKAVPNLTKR
jgi:hypothetical protein